MSGMLVGLCGYKGSGKSTAAAHLCAPLEAEGHDFVEITFAGPLKRACAVVFDLAPDQLDGPRKEEIDPRWRVSPRTLLQVVGTELFRVSLPAHLPQLDVAGGSVWIRRAAQEVRTLLERGRDVVVSDVRFDDEAHAILQLGGVLMKVVRPMGRDPSEKDAHASEAGIDPTLVRMEVANDGSVADLRRALDREVMILRAIKSAQGNSGQENMATEHSTGSMSSAEDPPPKTVSA